MTGFASLRMLWLEIPGNTTIEILDISSNDISAPNGLDDITRLLESTRLQKINLAANSGVFSDDNVTQRFARVLSRHEFLKGIESFFLLPWRNSSHCGWPCWQYNIGNIGRLFPGWSCCSDKARGVDATSKRSTLGRGNLLHFFDDEVNDATQHFVSTIQHKNSTVQDLPGISQCFHENNSRAATYASITNNSLTRNHYLNHVVALLTPPPPPPPPPHHHQQQQQPPILRNAGTMLMKIYHRAITKFAVVPNNAGASAMFKLFQARPALLEKRLKPPAAAAAAEAVSRQQQDYSHHSGNNDSNHGDCTATTSLERSTTCTIGGPPKRRRL